MLKKFNILKRIHEKATKRQDNNYTIIKPNTELIDKINIENKIEASGKDLSINDVLPTIVIYLNRKFEIDLDKAIEAVKKSQVLKECDENNDISMQEWLGKFLKEVGLDIESDKNTVKERIDEFIRSNSEAF